MKKLSQFIILLSVSSVIISCQNSSKESGNNQALSTEGMLQHNVYFYLYDSISETDKMEFEKGLQKLLSIKVIHKSEVGITGSTKSREVTDHEFEYSIFIWFNSMKNYEVYADHPDHLEFIDTYKHLWESVKVYDSEIIDLGN